jgi:hypothetical protein
MVALSTRSGAGSTVRALGRGGEPDARNVLGLSSTADPGPGSALRSGIDAQTPRTFPTKIRFSRPWHICAIASPMEADQAGHSRRRRRRNPREPLQGRDTQGRIVVLMGFRVSWVGWRARVDGVFELAGALE